LLTYIEHGCSGAVKHRDVRELPTCTLRAQIISTPCSDAKVRRLYWSAWM